MKMIKCIFTLLLTVPVLLLGFSFPAFEGKADTEPAIPSGILGTNNVGTQPEEFLQSGEWLYYLDGDEAIIAGYANKDAHSLVIPFKLSKHFVTGIGSEAFRDIKELKEVRIHSLITRIDQDAFKNIDDVELSAYSGSYAFKFAKSHSITINNLTNPLGPFYVSDTVIDLSGFPQNSIERYDDETIIATEKIASHFTSGSNILLREASSFSNLIVVEIKSIQEHNGNYCIHVEKSRSSENVIDRIELKADELSIDPDSIEMLVDGDANSVVSSSIPIKNKKFKDHISLSGTWNFTDWFSVTGTTDLSVDASASLLIVNPAPFVFLIQEADVRTTISHKDKLELKISGKDETEFEWFRFELRDPTLLFAISLTAKLSITAEGTVSVSVESASDFNATCKFFIWNITNNPRVSRNKVNAEVSITLGLPVIELKFILGISFNDIGLEIKFAAVKCGLMIEISAGVSFNQSSGTWCTDIGTNVHFEISYGVGIVEIKYGGKKLEPKLALKDKYTFKNIWENIAHIDHVEAGRPHYGTKCYIEDREIRIIYGNGIPDETTHWDACTKMRDPGIYKKDGKKFGGWYYSFIEDNDNTGGHGHGGGGRSWGTIDGPYIWDFDKYKLPYMPYDGYYRFEIRWINPGEEKEEPGPQPIGDKWQEDGEDTTTWHPKPPKPVEVTNITLNRTDEILHVDGEHKDTLYLYAVVSPANADNTSVTWTSSNPAAATVDNNGVVSAVAEGETTITCTSVMCPNVSASCKVTVYQPVYVSSIDLDRNSAELWANEAGKDTLQLKATVNPANATYSSVHWSSSNEAVAWVDGWGKVTALSPGKATITCQSIKNQDVTATCNVTIHQHVQNIYIDYGQDGLLPGETTQLSALCYPTNADNRNVNWNSSSESIATVDANGLVTAKGYGEAVITATATDGASAKGAHTVAVEHELALIGDVQADKLYLDGDYSTIIGYAYATQGSVRRMLKKGYDLEWSLLNGTGTVADAYIDVVSTTYTIDGKDYAIPSVVLYSGELHKAGSATFTLQCKAGTYTATVDLTINVSGDKLAKSVKLNPSKFELGMNEIATIPLTPVSADGGALPKILSVSMSGDAYYRNHVHESKDSGGLYVWFPESGQYTANVVYKAVNTTYTVPVTFEVRDGNGIMHLPVKSLSLSDNFLNMVVGDTHHLTAEALPADAYDKSFTWSSDDKSIATVSGNGVVTAKARGMVYIRCETNDGSGCYDSCVINVEPFMALNETSIEKTIYMDGQTHTTIDSCSLTYQSAIRIAEKGYTPNWTLRRVSGDATEIALTEFDSTAAGTVRIEGEAIELLRANHTGIDRYQLICEAGEHKASCDIILTVVEGGNLPATVTLTKDSYETVIGEAVEINTSVNCVPAGSKLPEDVSVSINPSKAFWSAMEEDTYFGDFNCIFAEAGIFTAELVYSGSNYRYAVPFTVRVKNASGTVPVTVQDIVMSKESVQLFEGEAVQLTASVLPENAAYGTLTWSSFDTSVATVSDNGKVTAMGAGITYVIASSSLSDRSAVCLVTVEDGLTLEKDTLTKTIFTDGTTRTTLDSIFLTEASSKRLNAAPEWRLQRVSGTNLTLRVSGCESTNESGDILYGCNVVLYSVSAEGQTIYDLTCANGSDSATARIIVNAVTREGNIPASIALSQTSYTAAVGELIVVKPEITCWPSGTQLPEGTRVTYNGNSQFVEALNQEDWFVSQSISTFSFKEAGRYEANCVYTYANMSYTIPMTFYIKDASGKVPVHGMRMVLNTNSLQMVAGDESRLEATFTPSDVTDSRVTWTSSDTSIVTVDANGRVQAKTNGTAQITCTPSDAHCTPVICYVTVEDYLTVETGAASYNCYLEGEQENSLSSAWLSDGTVARLNRDGVAAKWTLTTTDGNSAVVVGTAEKDGSAIRVSTTSLKSAGTTNYRIVCTVGSRQWSQDYSVVVNVAGVQAPKSVTLATPEVNLAVGETKTIDFSPVCLPSGSSLPAGVIKTYVGYGSFYDALDNSVYNRNGDNVTVAFTAPGRYLLSRIYRTHNLNYTALCVINVGSPGDTGFGLLKASEQECVVYMNGQTGVVSDISIYDATVYDRYSDELQWNVERISGDSISAGLVPNADTASLVVTEAKKTGRDIWRVSCSFGGVTDYIDVAVEVKETRKPIPNSIALSTQRVKGVIGDWLYLPLGVTCSPTGSALPEYGDSFWSFKMTGGLAEDLSESQITNGMLAVCFSESGYYSGTLTYASGNVSFNLTIYFTVSDEESQITTPDALKVWVVSDSNTVYPEGDTGVVIATAVLAESLNSYYSGTAPSYVSDKGIEWRLTVDEGNAATVSIKAHKVNTADIVLNSIQSTGDVKYTVSCIVDGKTYSGKATLHVASDSEARPDVTLAKSRYQVTQGMPALISRVLYQRSNGSVLQSAGEWNPGSALSAIGYTYETTDDAWRATFYQQGEYKTVVTSYVGNLRYEIPLMIKVVGKDEGRKLRTLKLPSELTSIEEEAFSGLTIQMVDLRGTKVTAIENSAFRNCVDMTAIYIPSTVTSIAGNAFYGCLNLTIHCVEGSYAAQYAAANGIGVSYDYD